MKEWLKQLPSQGLEAVDCGSFTLDAPQIAAVEKAVCDVQVRKIHTNGRQVKVRCWYYNMGNTLDFLLCKILHLHVIVWGMYFRIILS